MSLLHAQKAQSERAYADMERIRDELDAALAPPEEEPEVEKKKALKVFL